MSYAARHPDLFVAAARFSGALDLGTPARRCAGAPRRGAVGAVERAGDPLARAQPGRPRRQPARDGAVAVHRRRTSGWPAGRRGRRRQDRAADPRRERGVRGTYRHARDRAHLRRLRLGGHTGEYFKRDLQEALPGLMEALDHPPDPPAPFAFTATEQRFSVRGYTVRAARAALAFRTLSRVRGSGFLLTTDGPTTVVTAARYARSARYRVVVRPARRGGRGGGAPRAAQRRAGSPDHPRAGRRRSSGSRARGPRRRLPGHAPFEEEALRRRDHEGRRQLPDLR